MKLFHHKRNRHLLAAAAFIMQLLSASCTSDSYLDELGQPETSFVIQIEAANFSQSPASRSNNTNSNYTTTFASGDKAGLIAVDKNGSVVPELNNVPLNYDDSKWSFADGSSYYNSGYTYIAYYPYKEEASGLKSISELRQAFPPALDQSDISKYTTAEIMAAEGEWESSSNTLRFGMKYLHTLLVLPNAYDTYYQFSENSYSFSAPITNVAVTVGGKVYKAMNWTNNNLNQYRVVIPASNQERELRACLSGNDKSLILETRQTLAESQYYEWRNNGFDIGNYSESGLIRVGDFVCRTNDGNDWFIVPQEAYEAATNPIGVVFHVGHNAEKDDAMSVYQNQFKDGKFHGYAVALTDVGSYRWAYKDGAYSQNAGTSTNTGDWKGYSNQKAIENFADNNSDGWELKHFEAAYRCSLYGTDQGDNWQRRYAAPVNTSGWFLPSCNQLTTLYSLNRDNANLLATSMDNVKSLDKDHIRWFSTGWYYWSSTEGSGDSDGAWYVRFRNGSTYNYDKDYTFDVRAVLAF